MRSTIETIKWPRQIQPLDRPCLIFGLTAIVLCASHYPVRPHCPVRCGIAAAL